MPFLPAYESSTDENRNVATSAVRGAEAFDARLAVRRDDVAALAEVAGFAIDHVETIDGDHGLDPIGGRVRDADGVALAGVALDVEAILQRVGRRGLAVLADDLHVVRGADLGGRDRDRGPRPGSCGPSGLVGVRGASSAVANRREAKQQRMRNMSIETRRSRAADLNVCIVRAMASAKKAVKTAKSA